MGPQSALVVHSPVRFSSPNGMTRPFRSLLGSAERQMLQVQPPARLEDMLVRKDLIFFDGLA